MAGEHRLNILVIDRDEGSNIETKGLLREEGHQVQVLTEADQAVSAVAQADFQVVLVDVSPPDCSGIELLQKIRSADPGICLIAMTALPTVEGARFTSESVAVDTLQKPVDPAQLRAAIQSGVREEGSTIELNGRLTARFHLRTVLAQGVVAGILVAAITLVHAALLTPEMLFQTGGLTSIARSTAGVLVASNMVSLGFALVVGAFLYLLDALFNLPRRVITAVYNALWLAIPISVTALAWAQFGWMEGQFNGPSTMVLAITLFAAVAIPVLVASRAATDDPALPGYKWMILAPIFLAVSWLPRTPVEEFIRPPGAGAVSGGFASHESAIPPAEVVVLLVSDTLRADHVGAWGYGRDTTPYLDALAERGTVIEKMTAASSCTVPSTATVITGLQPWCSGVTSQHDRISANSPTLAERFKAQGYRTYAVVANVALGEGNGFARGFDAFHNVGDSDAQQVGENVSRKALELIDSSDGKVFVWIQYMDPHAPYTPRSEYFEPFVDDELYSNEKLPVIRYGYRGGVKIPRILGDEKDYGREIEAGYVVARYDGGIREMDRGAEIFVEGLAERGLLDDAAIAFTADHGESLTGHDYYFGHCVHTWDSMTHIPAFFVRPGVAPAGKRIQMPAAQIDVTPTLLALAGHPDADSSMFQGVNLLEDGSLKASRAVYSQSGWWNGVTVLLVPADYLAPVRALHQDGWKYIQISRNELNVVRTPTELVNTWRSMLTGIWQSGGLYNLQADPAETENLILADATRVAEMTAHLEGYPGVPDWQTCDMDDEEVASTSDAERKSMEEKLRLLGYME
jgi:arylsulfatase